MFFLNSSNSQKKLSQYFEKEKRTISSCEICERGFIQIINPKHKCKRCRRYICGSCGKNKTIILGIDLEKEIPHRTCDKCMKEMNFQVECIKKNKLKWNENSKISSNWEQLIKIENRKNFSYLMYHDLYSQNEERFSDDYDIIVKDIDDGRTDSLVWNFSMKDFLHKIQDGFSDEYIRMTMKNVLKAIIVRYPQMGYCQGMNYIITFLLCFCFEETAFWLFCHIIENILPPMFFQKSEKGTGLIGILAEKFVLSSFIQNSKEIEQDYKQLAIDFLDLKVSQWLLSIFANILSLETTLYIWNKMLIHNNFGEIERIILIMIKEMWPIYCEYMQRNYDTFLLNEVVAREMSVEIIERNNNLILDNNIRNQYYVQYFKQFAEKWHKNDNLIHKQLEKITYFSKQEIQILQTEFLKLLHQKEKQKLKQPEIKGITKDDFVSIMSLIFKSPSLQSKSMINPENNDDFNKIFDVFDDDKSGSLDFREFLCGMSLLMRGKIPEKIELCFYLFDKENKGYLTQIEVDSMIKTLLRSIKITFPKEKLDFFEESEILFKERMIVNLKNKEKICISDLLIIENDDFIKKITQIYKSILKKNNTTEELANTIMGEENLQKD